MRRSKRSQKDKETPSGLQTEVVNPDPDSVTEDGELAEPLPAAASPVIHTEDGVEILPAEEADAIPIEAEEVVSEPSAEVPSRTGDLVPYDPLEAYLRELRAYPALSRQEEHELAVQYHHHKQIEAAYKLVTSNLWLVVKIARDYERAARSLLDLIQEGNIGLMEAVKNFDPYRGVRFPSYAVWWIRAYIVRFIIANWRLVKIGTTQAQRRLFFNLKKEKDRLEREGFHPAPRLLAENLKVKESEVVEMEQRLAGADVSVDSPIQTDSETNLLSVLPAPQASAEEVLGNLQVKNLLEKGLEEFASTLKPREQIIFKERMLAEEKATLQDIAEKLSVSPERIRQIENRLRDRLREFLQSHYGAALEDV